MSFSGGVFSINSAGTPYVTGTVISSTAANALNSDLATGLSTCLLKDGTQTATAIIPFASGITVAGGATLSTYTTGTTATTFTFDGSGGTSASKTLTWQRIGNWVTLNIPLVTATTGTGSTYLASNTALAAGARPTANQVCVGVLITNNGAAVATPGYVLVDTGGLIYIYRDGATTAYTNTATGGATAAASVAYFVG